MPTHVCSTNTPGHMDRQKPQHVMSTHTHTLLYTLLYLILSTNWHLWVQALNYYVNTECNHCIIMHNTYFFFTISLSLRCFQWQLGFLYAFHGKFLPSVFLLSIFSFDLCICSQLMLNLLAFRAKMSFTGTLGDLVTEQLDILVAVTLSILR